MIAARQLVEEWNSKANLPTLRVYSAPREAYLAFCEWLFARIGLDDPETTRSGSFEMEVFRRMLPRYDIFQMVWAYLPKQAKVIL